MDAPERIWTASTEGKCHIGFDTPSMNYTIEYIRADLAAPDMAELVEAAEAVIPAALHFGGLTDAHLAAIERLETIIAKIKEPQHG